MATRVTWLTALPQDTLPDVSLDLSEHTEVIPPVCSLCPASLAFCVERVYKLLMSGFWVVLLSNNVMFFKASIH